MITAALWLKYRNLDQATQYLRTLLLVLLGVSQ
jgi:hypothetical protein